MKFLTVVLALHIVAITFSQDLKTKKENHKYFKEIYQIDKKTKIKEGSYKLTDNATGNILSEGQYSRGERVGLWKFYQHKGGLSHSYDYGTETLQLAPRNGVGEIEIPVLRSGEFVLETVDQEPFYLGYLEEFKDRILEQLNMGKFVEISRKKEGTTLLSMMIDGRGQLRAVRVEETHDLEVAKMLVEATKNVEGQWYPAIQDGSLVNARIYLIHDLRSRMSTDSGSNNHRFEDKPGIIAINMHFIGVVRTKTSTSPF